MPFLFDQQITFLYVTDLERSERFYGKTLGLERVLSQEQVRVFRIGIGTAFLGICHTAATLTMSRVPDRAPGSVIVSLVTDDVDAVYASLREKGVDFENPPAFNRKHNIYTCFFRDPDGYLLEIQRFQSKDWPRPHIEAR